MKKDRIILDFVRFPVAQKIEMGRSVSTNMKANPKFTTPDISIGDLEAKTDLLEVHSIASQNGGKEATALKRQTELDWDDMMRKMAGYVDRIADGDSVVILSAGFSMVKKAAPAVRPEFSVELGDKSGTVTLRRQAMEGAKSYIWQHCIGEMPAAENDWTTAQVTSKVTVELVGLIVLTKYWFRTAAVTPTGISAYGTPIMQVVI